MAAIIAARPRLARGADDLAQPAGKELVVRSASPFNAEPNLVDLAAEAVTPIPFFYVRNHGAMPEVDAKAFRLRVEGLVEKPLTLKLGEIQDRFKPHDVEATLTCAGNRREEMSAIKPTPGVQWRAGAIGHARWAGASLAELLKAAGLKPEAKHVWFEGLDPITEKDGSVAPFGGSIPLAKLQDAKTPTLVAWKMNGEPLPPSHGFPLRMIVPGYIGARSVKWLTKITVSDRPSPNHYVAEAYKIVKTDDKAEVAAADPIYEFPVNSAICTPADGATLRPDGVTIEGYALPSGAAGAQIEKVEVSTDGGKNWSPAIMSSKPVPTAWQLWTAKVALAKGKHELVVRAIDSRGNTQPEKSEWNLKGYLYNGWHRVRVEVV
jgi:sulfite oxidase